MTGHIACLLSLMSSPSWADNVPAIVMCACPRPNPPTAQCKCSVSKTAHTSAGSDERQPRSVETCRCRSPGWVLANGFEGVDIVLSGETGARGPGQACEGRS